MAQFLIITVVIVLVGIISYLTSAWFGYQSSGMGMQPPHYRKLMDRFKPKTKSSSKQEEDFVEENTVE
ncbi:hypothetical protein WBJ53_13960 [Spirosoma sp. SC4-14]|uniref:hypothetical protein n=1 Tax=Spirosoma sp. SC4-14 TaxID=3128900 RepID=UPI0030CF71F7